MSMSSYTGRDTLVSPSSESSKSSALILLVTVATLELDLFLATLVDVARGLVGGENCEVLFLSGLFLDLDPVT